jgi:acetolactate synthase-1/2/3 large subunit
MGMPGARIDRPGQITRELIDELSAPGLPVVLDIRHDPSVRIRGAGRVEALQHMSAPPPPMRPSARPGSIPPPSARSPLSAHPASVPPISVRVHQTTPPAGLRLGSLGRKSMLPPPPLLPHLVDPPDDD